MTQEDSNMSYDPLRSILTKFGYSAISAGIKLPDPLLGLTNDFLHRISLRDLLKQLKINCVIDVGAHVGSFSKMLRRIRYKGHIVCFEPNRDNFLLLSNAFKRDRSWKGFNVALGSENTKKTFNFTQFSNLGSFLKPKNEILAHTAELEVRRLDSMFVNILDRVESPRVFLKLDTQGYDLEVVKGACGCMRHILGLQSEISVQPLYDDMPHYLEALAFYESLGLNLINLFVVTRGKSCGNVVEYDCLMARFDSLTP